MADEGVRGPGQFADNSLVVRTIGPKSIDFVGIVEARPKKFPADFPVTSELGLTAAKGGLSIYGNITYLNSRMT